MYPYVYVCEYLFLVGVDMLLHIVYLCFTIILIAMKKKDDASLFFEDIQLKCHINTPYFSLSASPTF